MTDHADNPGGGADGRWLEGTVVPTYFAPAHGERAVVVFVRAGELDEPLPLSGITAVALRAAIAGLAPGHAVRELGVGGALSTISLRGGALEIGETLRSLAIALGEPDEDRIAAELQRAKSGVDRRADGLRELHLAKRFGSRGPGMSGLPQFGPFKAEVGDVTALAERAFVAGNAALLVVADEPWPLPFELPPAARLTLPPVAALHDLHLPAQTGGASEGVSVSFELPPSLEGRLALQTVARRLQARGTTGNLSAVSEQAGEGEAIGMIFAPVADAFAEEAGAALVRETAAVARTAPEVQELRAVGAAWLTELGSSPDAMGRLVVGELLLSRRVESRADLVDRLWHVEPAAVSLAAELMTRTTLLLLPPGARVDTELISELEPPEPPERVRGRRLRAVGGAISWSAHARGALYVGERGVSQVPRSGPVITMHLDDVEVLVDHDDGVMTLLGSRSWMRVDPRLWRGGEFARATILEQVPPDRVVPVPKGQHVVLAGEQRIKVERRAAWRSLAAALAILVGTVAFVALLVLWANHGADEASAGGCATVDRGRATRVDCSASEARARLLAIASPSDPARRKRCPAQTDDIVPMVDAVAESGCLRRLTPPHPADRGAGGGILRAGDCIVDPSAGAPGLEVRCGSRRDWATVAAMASGPARCSPPAVDVVQRPAPAAEPILCLARGPGIMTRGDCVTDPSVTELQEVRCGAAEAQFRVLARVATQRRCPARTEPAVAARALPRAAVVCLRRQ